MATKKRENYVKIRLSDTPLSWLYPYAGHWVGGGVAGCWMLTLTDPVMTGADWWMITA